jgi:hypothetical protein
MTNQQAFQLLSTLILAALLFLPVSKIIWVMSVRRLRRRLLKELEDRVPPHELEQHIHQRLERESQPQLKRARFIALFLVLIFSYFFNSSLLGELYG